MVQWRFTSLPVNAMRHTLPTLVTASAMCCGLLLAPGVDAAPAVDTSHLQEVRHTVAYRHTGTTVEAKVQRRFVNRSAVATDFELSLAVPTASAMVSFRSRTGRRWRNGELLENDEAWRRFGEMQIDPSGKPRQKTTVGIEAPSLFGHGAELNIPLVRPHQTVDIEYQLIAPTCYRAGAYYWSYPLLGAQIRTRVIPRSGGTAANMPPADPDAISMQSGCEGIKDGAPVFRLPHTGQRDGAARLAYKRISQKRVMGRLEFELPVSLQPPPSTPTVVFVVDASRSEGRAGLTRQLATVRLLATQYIDAQFQVVAFHRSARTLFPAFVPGSKLDDALDQLPRQSLTVENGSNLSLGLAKAASILKSSSGAGDRRVVVFTDGAMRLDFRVDNAIRALEPAGSGTVLHLVYTSGRTGAELTLNDAGGWPMDRLANTTGGTAVVLDGTPRDTPNARRRLSHLVTPNRIDRLKVDAPIAFETSRSNGFFQRQSRKFGAGVGRNFVLTSDAPLADLQRLGRISGLVWGRPWTMKIANSAALTTRLGALAIGDGAADQLYEPELLTWAKDAHAASRATSFLTSVPRPVVIPPPTERFRRSHRARPPRVRIGRAECVSRNPRWRLIHQAELREQLRDHLRACAPNSTEPNNTVVIEMTPREVVAVEVRSSDPRAARCMEDWAWGLKLGKTYSRYARLVVQAELNTPQPKAPTCSRKSSARGALVCSD